MANIQIRHTGIIQNGKKYYDNPSLHKARMAQLEGKRFEEYLEKEKKYKTQSQLAYYFGGIIRKTLMSTEIFGGQEFKEIDKILRSVVRTEKRVIVDKYGKEKSIDFVNADIENFSIDEMAMFIDDVLNWLSKECGIIPLSPEEYNLKNYVHYKK